MQFGYSRITGRLFNNTKLYRLLNDNKALWEGTEDGLQSISYEAPARIPNRHFLHHLYATPISGQTVCPEIVEATQFARPTTFGLGHLAYCGALEIRAYSPFVVRRSSQWGALGP